MKFLIIGKPKEELSTLPPNVLRPLVEASTAAVIKQKNEGKFSEIYWIPGSSATVTIGECKSAEDLMKNFSDVPIAFYYNYETYPLADFNETMKITIEKLKEAEKMMPPTPK